MNVLYVAVGGALGSVLRFIMQNLIGKWLGMNFPYGTLLVNISGSIAMGVFMGWMTRITSDHANDLRLFIAVGILGGYTTFSSFSLDAFTLMKEGNILGMAAYVVLSVVCAIFGLMVGHYLIRIGA